MTPLVQKMTNALGKNVRYAICRGFQLEILHNEQLEKSYSTNTEFKSSRVNQTMSELFENEYAWFVSIPPEILRGCDKLPSSNDVKIPQMNIEIKTVPNTDIVRQWIAHAPVHILAMAELAIAEKDSVDFKKHIEKVEESHKNLENEKNAYFEKLKTESLKAEYKTRFDAESLAVRSHINEIRQKNPHADPQEFAAWEQNERNRALRDFLWRWKHDHPESE